MFISLFSTKFKYAILYFSNFELTTLFSHDVFESIELEEYFLPTFK